jgi:hypothetical protein
MGVGSIHGKNQETRVAADRSSVLSGNAPSGPSHVGSGTGLKAKISVLTNNPARGSWVTLSAEHSGSHIKEYEWSFAYADEPTNDTEIVGAQTVPPLKVCSKTNVKIRILVLRSLKVTLTVTDNENSSAVAQGAIEVDARKWKTKFARRPLRHLDLKILPGQEGFGLNNCTTEGDRASGHILHRAKPTTMNAEGDLTYGYEDDKVGFAVDQVSDPGGPFHEFYYVSSCKLYIDRTPFVNRRLLPPNGEVYAFNQGSPEYSKCLATIVKSVTAHEEIHTDLIAESLDDLDPAPKLENFIHTDRDQLRLIANQACDDADSSFQEATGEDNVHARLKLRHPEFNIRGKILITDTDEYYIENIAEMGDKGSVSE